MNASGKREPMCVYSHLEDRLCSQLVMHELEHMNASQSDVPQTDVAQANR
jgi:hypothetical protein